MALIENKEMAAQVMSTVGSNSDFNMVVHQQGKEKSSKDLDINLTTKTKCKMCDRQMLKFKLRKGMIKEFSHCIDCWKAQHSNGGNTNRTIFHVIGGILRNNNTPSSAPLQKGTTSLKKPVSLEHHIFNRTYGWLVKQSR